MVLHTIYILKIPKLVYSVQTVFLNSMPQYLTSSLISPFECIMDILKLVSSPELLIFHSVPLSVTFTISTDHILILVAHYT